MARKSTGMALSIILAGLLIFVSLAPVAADPVQDKKNQLESIKNEVQKIDAQLESITEQYNMTNVRIQQTRDDITRAEAQVASLTSQLQQRKDILGSRLRELYKNGNADMLEVLTECKTVEDLYVNIDRAQRIGGEDVSVIASVIGAREQVDAAKNDLENRKAELDQTVSGLASQKSQIEANLQKRKDLVAGVESEVNNLIAQEAAARAAANNNSGTVRRSSPSRNIPPPPPPPPYAPRVVQIAYQQIGKPYVYAGSGPNVFDCSGLVMYCYAQVGISLPHSSYMQKDCGVPVSYDQLQPGDLVFFHGYGHVGMYVGGGQFIHAPHTGDVVRVANLGARSDFCGACRIL
jgi:cell wall-associated NlpC family hydrolase